MSGITDTARKVTAGFPPKQPRSWLGFLLLAQGFLLINGPALVGRTFDVTVGTFYVLFFVLVPLVLDDKLKHELLKGTLREYAMKFAVGYGGTLAFYLVVFVQLAPLRPARIPIEAVWSMILLQLFFVAPGEELFFRGWLPRLFDPKGKSWKLYGSVSVSNAFTASTFATFHYAAYGAGGLSFFTTSFLITFLLANVWLYLSRKEVGRPFHKTKRPLGIPLTMGSHFAWNLCTLGIITGGVLLSP